METKCALQLCIAQLHSSAVAYDAQTRSYRVGHASFDRVQVVGVLVKRSDAHLKLDDGTGLLDVKLVPSTSGTGNQELQLGALVECVGGIEEPWPPSEMSRSRRWMNAAHVHEVHDRNTETLRMLEVMHLYKNDYAVHHSSPPAALKLLAFPSIGNGVDNSEQSTANGQQHANGQQTNQLGTATTLIEKPWEQCHTGALHQDSGIPPADYQFALPEKDQELIKQGAKSLEIR
ncbi:PUA-like domain [Phytophthora cinnamomi]|uniref:PUA-like domain n=1 Tax=Phytophthora cinnamomi TaxID=4785 RepID=UPI0035594C1C|nr:PUA-like domain [Phytophthora cinnamomi]